MNITHYMKYAPLLLCIILCSCTTRDTAQTIKYSGRWRWFSGDRANSFTIILKQKGDSVMGQYCAVYNNGQRLDCPADEQDLNMAGRIEHDSAIIVFNSFFDEKEGVAVLKVKGNSLDWYIKSYPADGVSYAPNKAMLVRQKDR